MSSSSSSSDGEAPPGKQNLRALVRGRLRALSPADIAAKSARICAALRALPEWRGAECACLFAAQPSEPHLDALWSDAAGKTLCLPRVRDAELDLVAVENPAALELSRWGIREPRFDAAKHIAPQRLDLILVPGLAFSRAGARLGRGGGFYDRLLAARGLRAAKIGICFEEQILPDLPREAHDREVDAVLTEAGLRPA